MVDITQGGGGLTVGTTQGDRGSTGEGGEGLTTLLKHTEAVFTNMISGLKSVMLLGKLGLRFCTYV